MTQNNLFLKPFSQNQDMLSTLNNLFYQLTIEGFSALTCLVKKHVFEYNYHHFSLNKYDFAKLFKVILRVIIILNLKCTERVHNQLCSNA